MPVTVSPSRQLQRLRRKRQSSQALGLCYTCCVAPVVPNRRICATCNEKAKARVIRSRAKRREEQGKGRIRHGHEAAGDAAMERYAYVEAGAQFERALEGTLAPQDEMRLCEKTGHAAFYGARPEFALPWFERAYALVKTTEPRDRLREIALMLQFVRQHWLESRTHEGLRLAIEAHELASQVHASLASPESLAILRRADITMANYLVLLGRHSEAAEYVVHDDTHNEPRQARVMRIDQRAIVLATQGRLKEAFADFERALADARELTDGYLTTSTWDDYANWAMELGRFDIARTCRESALIVARERRIAWRIPYMTLRFAGMLLIAGEYAGARNLLGDALTYETATPVIHVLKATVGVELATILGDDALLERTYDEHALEQALRSREPARIGPIVAAYAKHSIECGRIARARTLIRRGLPLIHSADHVGDILALAALYGTNADAQRSRSLLIARAKLPHGDVARAYLALWSAYDAKRFRRKEHLESAARSATELFAKLGWNHQRTMAQQLLRERPQRLPTETSTVQPMLQALKNSLTPREQEIAEFILRGLTNKAISAAVGISEHTVESHVTSILNRLGLRSRWQLLDMPH